MRIDGGHYRVEHDIARNTVVFSGYLRLHRGDGYRAIEHLLLDAHANTERRLSLDLRSLELMNCAGINMLCNFVIRAKRDGRSPVAIIGNKDIAWQHQTLQDLCHLWPQLELHFE